MLKTTYQIVGIAKVQDENDTFPQISVLVPADSMIAAMSSFGTECPDYDLKSVNMHLSKSICNA